LRVRSFESACEFDGNLGVIPAEGDDIEAQDFSGEIGCGAGFAARGDFLEAVEVFGDAEAKGFWGISEEVGQGVHVVGDQGSFLCGVASFKFRDDGGVIDAHGFRRVCGEGGWIWGWRR
jgi:hypothetical protein